MWLRTTYGLLNTQNVALFYWDGNKVFAEEKVCGNRHIVADCNAQRGATDIYNKIIKALKSKKLIVDIR